MDRVRNYFLMVVVLGSPLFALFFKVWTVLQEIKNS